MFSAESVQLKTGELATVYHHNPDGMSIPEWAPSLWQMVIRPHDPWISRVETIFFNRILAGKLAGTNADQSYSVWIDERPAAHAAMLRARDNEQVGLVSFVMTDPGFRGMGLSSLLMERLMDDFWADGGQYALLGTANPVAHAIYTRYGFRDYNGHVMRYVSDIVQADDVDADYFANSGPATARAGHWGDGARVGWLYAKQSEWLVKDYMEALYGHPDIEHARCGSVLPSMMLNVEERGGGLWVLETQERRLVGAATLTYFDRAGQATAPVVDLLVVPAYLDRADDLLHGAIGAAETAGARHVRAYLASCDVGKQAIVDALGFRQEASLAGQFAAGKDTYDLLIYTYSL